MLAGDRTSLDWQSHTGQICVLPIGSFEQHGAHLPLATDNIGVEFFARLIAEELGSALLPVVPFGTCMEHSGFRGSVSLRPETLMQIVRDVAEEVGAQKFTRLILVNGHGGNFALGPVVRDWNRHDHHLKILLVNFWDFWEGSATEDSQPEIHAGEQETSLMLAIRPDLVQVDKLSAFNSPYGRGELPLAQHDLNTFGSGHFNALGVIGDPSSASVEKGRALIELTRSRMLPYIRDRLRRLDEQPQYSGQGGIVIRTMQDSDLPDALRLTRLIGWNQTAADWQVFLQENPAGCYVAVRNGHVVGTTTTIRYGAHLAWISMVLVEPQFRRLGIASRLLQQALQGLKDCAIVKLDATPTGREVYEKIGFAPEYSLRRWTHQCLPPLDAPCDDRLRLISAECREDITRCDEQSFGAPRPALLQNLVRNDPARAWCLMEGEQLVGFCLGRRGENFHQVGPINTRNLEEARLLAQAALSTLRGHSVVLDVPDHQSEFTAWLQELGFVEQRPFLRMTRSLAAAQVKTLAPQQFAICGPEFG